MYIVNDINHLLHLAKLLKVHELMPDGTLFISKLKRMQHDQTVRQQLLGYKQIGHLNVDEWELFETWRAGASRHLSEGDLSTVYIALKNPRLKIILSDDDLFLADTCHCYNVQYMDWDDLIIQIADERTNKMYELIKA